MRRNPIRRIHLTVLALLAVISLTAATAFAAQPHLAPNITTTPGSLIVDVQASGLGSGTAVFFGVEAFGTGTAICKNPTGKEVPGKKPVSVDIDAISDLKFADGSGNTSTTLVAEAEFPSPKAAGCPNGFTVSVFNVDWTGAIVTLYAATSTGEVGEVLDQQAFTCNTTVTSTGTEIKCKPTQ